jgi:hypothetical protein
MAKKTENKDNKNTDSQYPESGELIEVLNKISENLQTQNELLQKQIQQGSSQSFNKSANKAVKVYRDITAALSVSKVSNPESTT